MSILSIQAPARKKLPIFFLRNTLAAHLSSMRMARSSALSAELISSMQSHKGIWSSDPGKGLTAIWKENHLVMSTNLGFENTDTILVEDRVFAPSSDVVNNDTITAYMKSKGFDNYEDFYQWSLAHRYEYWDDQAKELHWFELWQTTFEWTNKPFFKWFVGGKFNIVYNCLDRHVQTPTRSKIAYYWEGDDGAIRLITYKELYVITTPLANGLPTLQATTAAHTPLSFPLIPHLVAAGFAG